MDTQQKQAFDLARDTTNQLITISTVFIAFTVTFSRDLWINPMILDGFWSVNQAWVFDICYLQRMDITRPNRHT